MLNFMLYIFDHNKKIYHLLASLLHKKRKFSYKEKAERKRERMRERTKEKKGIIMISD